MACMGDHSKIERRHQHIRDALDSGPAPQPELPRCHCGAPAWYEINRIDCVDYVCAAHLQPDGLG